MAADATATDCEPKRRRRPFRLVLVGGAAIVLLAAAGYGLWYAVAAWRLSAALEEARQRGEPIWFADLEPEPIDATENGGPLLAAALEKCVEPSGDFEQWYSAANSEPGKRVTVYGTGGRKINAGPGDYPVFRKALDENAAALTLLREAISRPRCRLPLDYGAHQPARVIARGLPAASTLGHLLAADVLDSLGTGRPGRARSAVEQMFGLSECLREEPFVSWKLKRIGLGGLALNSLEHVLAHGAMTDEQCARLDTRLADAAASFRLKDAVLAERVVMMTSLEYADELPDSAWYDDAGVLQRLFGGPRITEDQVVVLDLMRRVSETIDVPGAAALQATQDAVGSARVNAEGIQLGLDFLPSLHTAGLRYRQLLVNARLGMRVHRYREQHSQFPRMLEDVLDAQLSEIPAGIFTGKPLIYRASVRGFAIYALGPNGQDDGGSNWDDAVEAGTAFRVTYPAP